MSTALTTEPVPSQELPPLTAKQQKVTDNLSQLLDVLPPRLHACLEREDRLGGQVNLILRTPGRDEFAWHMVFDGMF